MRFVSWTHGLARDLRLAVRELRRSWTFTGVTVATLALGFGVNATMFAVADAVLFRSMPFTEPDRLVVAGEDLMPTRSEVSYVNFTDWRARATLFERLAAMGSSNWTLTLQARDPIAVPFRAVSGDFFDLLGARAALGRTLGPDDDRRGAPRVVVISHGLWQREFGRAQDVVGRSVVVDRAPVTIVGVMPQHFRYPAAADVWAPLVPTMAAFTSVGISEALEDRGVAVLHVLGRLKPGVALEGGRADLARIVRDLAAEHGRRERVSVRMTALGDEVLGAVRPAMWALMAAVILLLCVATANVSALMLVRAAARTRDVTVLMALGATRALIARRLLAECAVLAALSAVAALGLARAALPIVRTLVPQDLPSLDDAGIDARVAMFTAAAAATVAALCWTGTAMTLRGSTIESTLRSSGRAATPGGLGRTARRALVVGEVAAAVVLVALAGLLYRSVHRLERLDVGFDTRGLVAFETDAPARLAGATQAEIAQYHAGLVEAVATVPLVESVAAILTRPLKGPIGLDSSWRMAGQTEEAARENPWVNTETITPGYFATMGTPLKRGRAFSERDRTDTEPVVIVSEKLAAWAWPGQDPVGRRLRVAALGGADAAAPWWTVVGVAADVRYRDLRAARFDVYAPLAQSPFAAGDLMVRLSGPAAAIVPAVREAIRRANPDGAVTITRMDQVVAAHQAPWRANLTFIGGFASLTVALALIGVYALLASMVAERSREIGIRLALGATARRVIAMVLAEGGRLAIAGVALGVVVALAGARTVQSLLFEVPALDALTLVATPVVLLMVALAACALPAARAARVDPAITLRAE